MKNEPQERHYNKITFFILFALFIIISICCLNSCKKTELVAQKLELHILTYKLIAKHNISYYQWTYSGGMASGMLFTNTFSFDREVYRNGEVFTLTGVSTDTIIAQFLIDNVPKKQTIAIDSVYSTFKYE